MPRLWLLIHIVMTKSFVFPTSPHPQPWLFLSLSVLKFPWYFWADRKPFTFLQPSVSMGNPLGSPRLLCAPAPCLLGEVITVLPSGAPDQCSLLLSYSRPALVQTQGSALMFTMPRESTSLCVHISFFLLQLGEFFFCFGGQGDSSHICWLLRIVSFVFCVLL